MDSKELEQISPRSRTLSHETGKIESSPVMKGRKIVVSPPKTARPLGVTKI